MLWILYSIITIIKLGILNYIYRSIELNLKLLNNDFFSFAIKGVPCGVISSLLEIRSTLFPVNFKT